MGVCASLLVAAALISTSPAQARRRDRTSATQSAQELRVTSLDAYQVSLAWDAAFGCAGGCSYLVQVSDGRELSLAQGTTNVRLSWGVSAAFAYRFSVVAVDVAGNHSRPSNVVSVTRPTDRTPPSVPSLSLAYAGSDRVALTWPASREDGPSVRYEVSVNGSPVLSDVWATSATISNLTPDSAYVFSVRAQDASENWSAASGSLTVRTLPRTAGDSMPPSTPSNLVAFEDYCGDLFLVWNESFDDRDAAAEIKYDVYVNGNLQHTVAGRGWAAFMVSEMGPTQFTVVAVDSSGNASPPAFVALDMDENCEP